MSFLLLILIIHWIATGSIPETIINKQLINHDYIVVRWYNMNWISAEMYCQQNYDSHLATILTQKDYDLLYNYSNGIGMIGLKRNEQTGEWFWIANSLQHIDIINDLNTNKYNLDCSKIDIVNKEQYEISAVDCETIYDTFYCNKARSYIYVEHPMTYIDAERYCISEYGTHLATMTRWFDIENAQQLIKNNNRNIWFGLYSNDNHNVWLDGTEYNENEMNDLFEFNGNINLNCNSLNMDDNNYIINQNECGELLPFLCNKRHKVREYIIHQKTMSFIESQKYCLETHGTDLATIITGEEFSDAMKLVPHNSEGAWIGLNKQQQWNWIDNTQCTEYNNECIPYWFNNGIIIEPIHECAYVWKHGGRARTSVCTESMNYFLCNKPVNKYPLEKDILMSENDYGEIEKDAAQMEDKNIESAYSLFHGKPIYYLHANEPYDATYKMPKEWIVMAGYIAVAVVLVSIVIYVSVYCLFIKKPSKRKRNRSRISAV